MAERMGNPIAAQRWYEQACSVPAPATRWWYFLGRAYERSRAFEQAAYAYTRFARASRRARRPFRSVDGGMLDFDHELHYTGMAKPAYAYAVQHACLLASALGVDRIRVAEVGVAGGQGLLALEHHASTLARATGVTVEVFGLDNGSGLPRGADHRDVQHYFQAGDYAMDEAELRTRLTSAQLIIGDVRETFESWLRSSEIPVGAVLNDVDLYASTAPVLAALGAPNTLGHLLPRVSMFFDDLVPKKREERLKDYSDFTGEALAISDFNEGHATAKISRDLHTVTLPRRLPWHQCAYLLHRFDHPDYSTPVREGVPDRLRLSGAG